jgi:hypothetical protein
MVDSPVLPGNSTARLLTVGAGALALSGVVAYWIAATAQCGLPSVPPTIESCPLSSTPVLGFLTILTFAVAALALFSIYGRPVWSGSVASAILVAGALEFPVNHIFTALVIPPGVLDPMSIATALILVGGIAGFVASAWLRGPGVTAGAPYNRLAFASALVALTALASYWFPGSYPGAVYGPGCSSGGVTCMYIGQTPIIPRAAIAILILLALTISIPIFVRTTTAVSATCAIAVLVAVGYWWSALAPYPSLAIAMFTIVIGAVVALSGSVPHLWSAYVVPRFTPPASSAQR